MWGKSPHSQKGPFGARKSLERENFFQEKWRDPGAKNRIQRAVRVILYGDEFGRIQANLGEKFD